MRRILAAFLLVLAILAAVIGGGALWFALRDPYAALPKADAAPVVAARWSEQRDGRRLLHVTLETHGLGPVSFVVSLPEGGASAAPLPVVAVLGGFATGERNIAPITGIGANAVAGYDWPIPTAMPNGLALLRAAPELYRRALTIPGQIATMMVWLRAQGWADPARTTLMGVSLGALAAPAAQRVAAAAGAAPGWTILAYGGAPIGDLVDANPFVRPPWVRPLLRLATDLLLRPLEPGAHLPHLAGRFLVIEGSADQFVPPAAAARLRELTPEPKKVIRLPGGHIGVGPDKQRILDEVLRQGRAWLVAEGAVNPPP